MAETVERITATNVSRGASLPVIKLDEGLLLGGLASGSVTTAGVTAVRGTKVASGVKVARGVKVTVGIKRSARA